MSQTSQASTPLASDLSQTSLLYAWAPREAVGFIQAVVDASEGLARIRTERHDDNRSLLLFMVSPTQQDELLDLLRYLSESIDIKIEIV